MKQTQNKVSLTSTGGLLLPGTHMVEFSLYDVSISVLPKALDGLTVVQMSDIHFGPWLTEQMLGRVVESVNRLSPGLVVLTGDYVGYRPEPATPCAKVLGGLRAPTFAILGNHDHWAGAEEVSGAFQRAGISVLRNEWRALSLRGEHLYVVGLDDLHTNHHDPIRAFKGLPEDGPVIFLSHVPEGADLPEAKRAHLVLSGHTHGGQLHIPKLTQFLLKRAGINYVSGRYPLGGERHLYVNRGLGAAAFPLRWKARPEVGVFTLRCV